MGDLYRWTKPTVFTCITCGVLGSGCLSAGFFGEPVETLPPGWLYRRRVHGQPATFYACSETCAKKCEQSHA